MRRIVPILIAVLLLGASQAFADSASKKWSEVQPGDCKEPTEQARIVCAEAKKVACGSATNADCNVAVDGDNREEGRLRYSKYVNEGLQTGCSQNQIPQPRLVEATEAEGIRKSCEYLKGYASKGIDDNKKYAVKCRVAIARCHTAFKLITNPSGLQDTCDNSGESAARTAERQMADYSNDIATASNCEKNTGSDNKSADGSGKKDSNSSKTGGMGGLPINPQALMQMMQAMNQNQNEDQTQEQPPAIQDCSQNPNLAGCMQAQSVTAQSWNQPMGEASTTDSSDSSGNADFDTADISGMQPASLDAQQKQFGTPATTAPVPNGGGQMLGGGGGGSASVGGGQPASYGGNPSKKVEVQTGSGGGGYSQTAAGMNMKSGESGGGYTYGGGGGGSGGGDNFDLSSFLPGGKHDPFKGRSIAGTVSGTGNFQIQSKDVNLFSRISERIKSRCAQGLLRDCIP